MAFLKSFWRVIRYHIGSMAFGSMIVALVQLARIILAYIDSQTKTWQDKSKALKVAFKVVACCLWCFEKLVKFITRNAYIFIAINGKSFCVSAKHAFMTILKNLFLVAFVNLVSVILSASCATGSVATSSDSLAALPLLGRGGVSAVPATPGFLFTSVS